MKKGLKTIEIRMNTFILVSSMIFAFSVLALSFFVAYDRVKNPRTDVLGSSTEERKVIPTIDVSGNLWKPLIFNDNSSGKGVFMILFADYECPFSKRFYGEVLTPLIEEYVGTDFVSFGIVNFPQSFHPQSMNASKYVECVLSEDGNTSFMDNVGRIYGTDITLYQAKDYLDDLYKGSKKERVKECMNSSSEIIENDINNALKLGVNTTPTLMIGVMRDNYSFDAELISGSYDYQDYADLIDDYLER